ncbi:MAG: metal-sensing transcriptional repressor [Armatimonadetes bacterium]|nr:metal-sensing transcriptional repressor [Armatimonadota bacterium]
MATHTHTREVMARLARIEGHVGAIKRMVEANRPCPEVLVQISAVRAALDKVAKVLLADHMEHCVLESLQDGDAEKHLQALREALERFIA